MATAKRGNGQHRSWVLMGDRLDIWTTSIRYRGTLITLLFLARIHLGRLTAARQPEIADAVYRTGHGFCMSL